MAKKISLKDIAEKVGVSTALVSYVISGREKEKRVGAELVKKIREVARELNYQPNQIAQSLRTGITNTIGLIVADIANPFFGNLARMIEDEASRCGYTVIIGSSDEDSSKSEVLIDTLRKRQVDGFIIVPAEGSLMQIKLLQESGVPLVLTDRYFEEVKCNYVGLDNFGATYDAISHLIENGYKRIGIIVYKSGLIHMQERIRGYVEAMKANQLEKEIRIEEINYELVKSDIEQCMNILIGEQQKIEALLFATNALTISGLYCIKGLNLNVPEDLAIIGFDGNAAYDFFYTPLTYIEQPIEEIGKQAVRVLIDQINGSDKIENIKLQYTLIKRQSSQ
jgi:LacI family transcriptional regulator